GKFVKHNTRIRNYLSSIRADLAFSVDKPPSRIGIVVPESKRSSRFEVEGIGIDETRPSRPISWIEYLEVGSARLHREINRDLNPCRQWKGRFLDGDGRNVH